MSYRIILFLMIVSMYKPLMAQDAPKLSWSVDGHKNLFGVQVHAFGAHYNALLGDVGISFGPSINYSRIFNEEYVLDVEYMFAGSKYEPSPPSFAHVTDYRIVDKGKIAERQVLICMKRYFPSSGNNVAPIGSYFRFGLGHNRFTYTEPRFENQLNTDEVIESYSWRSTSTSLVAGIGRDFRLSERFFMSLGVKTNLLLGFSSNSNARRNIVEHGFPLRTRNFLLADYGISYLF